MAWWINSSKVLRSISDRVYGLQMRPTPIDRLAATPLPSEAVSTQIGDQRRKLNFARLLLPYWKPFALGILAVIFQALTDVLQPWPLKIVVDLVGEKPMPSFLAPWVTTIFGTDNFSVLSFIPLLMFFISSLDS